MNLAAPCSRSEDSLSDDSIQTNNPTNKCVLFVGNLSYFCEEKHLRELFQPYGCLLQARVMHNEHNTRSLMYGFVTLSSPEAAREMERIFDNHMFMGRQMR
jgi:RNA recognition motif-containing protein